MFTRRATSYDVGRRLHSFRLARSCKVNGCGGAGHQPRNHHCRHVNLRGLSRFFRTTSLRLDERPSLDA